MAQCAHRQTRRHRPLTLSSGVLGGSARYRSPFFLLETEGDTLGDTQWDTASPCPQHPASQIARQIQRLRRYGTINR